MRKLSILLIALFGLTLIQQAQTITVNLPVTLTTNQVKQLLVLRQIYGLTNLTLRDFSTNVLNTQISPSALNLLRERRQRLKDLVDASDDKALTALENSVGLAPMTVTNQPSNQ